MSIKDLLANAAGRWTTKLPLRVQERILSEITSGPHAWQIYNRLDIPGFGTNLARFFFPLYSAQSTEGNSFSKDTTSHLQSLFHKASKKHKDLQQPIVQAASRIAKLPAQPEEGSELPNLDNYFFGLADCATYYALIKKFHPSKILEIGSGISTLLARLAISENELSTQITCIDPEPRASISQCADQHIQSTFEDYCTGNSFDIKRGDFLFLDGSHYVFPRNDTLHFFFHLLPQLPAGVFVHIHDIYLPADYDEAASEHLWSEQYLLAAWLLGGAQKLEVLVPVHYLVQFDEEFRKAMTSSWEIVEKLPMQKNIRPRGGYSFWMKTV